MDLSLQGSGRAADARCSSAGSGAAVGGLAVRATTDHPFLSHGQLCIAELAWVARPILLWQMNLRLRKLGLEESETLGEALGKTYCSDWPEDYVAKNKQAFENLVISKGGTVDMAAKAARQGFIINCMIDNCKVWGYTLGQRFFDEEDLMHLAELLKQPDFTDVREAVEIFLLIAQELVAALQ